MQQHFKTMILLLAMMEVSRIVVVPTRTTRVFMKTSRPNPNPRLERNLTQTTTVAPATATLRWKMQTAMRGELRSDRRRN